MNFNFPHLFLQEMESTNTKAIELLSKTNPSNGFVVITDYQTAGKGQYGRKWSSEPAKNLLLSIILSPSELSIHELFRLHLVSSISILRALNKWKLPQLTLKWPNDIYIGSKKIAGILIQNQIKELKVEWSVIGIGLNVNQINYSEDLQATSLKLELGHEINREDLIEDIRNRVLSYFSHQDKTNWELLLEEYNQHLFLKDQIVSISIDGLESFEGKICGVNRQGQLQIQKLNKELTNFNFGELQYHKIKYDDK